MAPRILQGRGHHPEAGISQWPRLGIAQHNFSSGDLAGPAERVWLRRIIQDTTHTPQANLPPTGEVHSTNQATTQVQNARVFSPLAVHRELRCQIPTRTVLYLHRMQHIENRIGSPNSPTNMRLDLTRLLRLVPRRMDST